MTNLPTALASLTLLATLGTAPTPAAAAPAETLAQLGTTLTQAWYQSDGLTGPVWLLADGHTDGFKPAKCTQLLATLRAANVPATAKVTLDRDTPTLKGGTHALPAAKAACDAIERQGKIKELERWLKFAAEGESTSQMTIYETCKSTYDQVIDAGIPATTPVPAREIYVRGKPLTWSGTIQSLRVKYCDGPLARAAEKLETLAAPYKAVLKGDKLAMALGYDVHAKYAIKGGDWSMDPKKLAAATVWFDMTSASSNEAQVCADGRERHYLRRYTFDAAHQVKSTTQREICGDPTPAMYK